MKRVGGLYERICDLDTLIAAGHQASQRKRAHRACFRFRQNWGANMFALQEELQSQSYRPHPCNRFWVTDGRKPRLIEAPAFRDLVVQHAVYAVASPVLSRGFISTSFACRKGYGTHRAADWLQSAMRRASADSWILHIDVRKFFYSMDRDILLSLQAKSIKCQRTLWLLGLMSHRDEPVGISIGYLISQVSANVYLNVIDQFAKRELKVADYGRYMDDMIMIAPSRQAGLEYLDAIRGRLADLRLGISHHSLQPIRRGANFVGFRTWRSARFVRPHVISALRRDARRGRLEGVVSRLGHARRTCSFRPMMTYLQEHQLAVYQQMPQSFKDVHTRQIACK